MTASPPQAGVRPPAGRRAADILRSEMPEAVDRIVEEFDEDTIYLHRDHLVRAATLLRDSDAGAYRMPVLVTAVDWLDREPERPRFDVVYQLRSVHHNDVCRLIVQVTEDDPSVPTLERVFAGMDWHEREAYDLLGIIFTGHHDLQRLLLPTDWVGHPLRKDYVSFGEPVAFTHNLEWALPPSERPADMPGEGR